MSEHKSTTQDAGTAESGCSDEMMALNYYRAAFRAWRPDFVPCRVRLGEPVRGDGPFRTTVALAGDYDCECNQWGACSVRATNGQLLGIKPGEFEPIAFRPNVGLEPRGNRVGSEPLLADSQEDKR